MRSIGACLILLAAGLRLAAAALAAGRNLPEVPIPGKRRVGSFQSLENYGVMTSNAWN